MTRTRRAVMAIPKRVVKPLLRALARRRLFVQRGLFHPYEAITHSAFMGSNPMRMQMDYALYATTELICREIELRGVGGAIAGLGVGQGLWARQANRFLPTRALYLFDTFTGFPAEDLHSDISAGLSAVPPYEAKPSPVSDLLRSLPNAGQADVRAGRFPDTTRGLEGERYCLVQIDVGTYTATAAGLAYFWPRLSPGGTIIVADYNNSHAPGARRACLEHLDRNPAATAVLPDVGGSLLIIAAPRSAGGSASG